MGSNTATSLINPADSAQTIIGGPGDEAISYFGTSWLQYGVSGLFFKMEQGCLNPKMESKISSLFIKNNTVQRK